MYFVGIFSVDIWRTAPASRANKPTQHPFPTMSVEAIVGVWSCRKEGTCACGYVGDWRIVSLPDEELRCEELPGSYCCGFIPNCFPKRGRWAHQMAFSEPGRWEGTSGCKAISLEVMDTNTLRYITTDGLCILTRA